MDDTVVGLTILCGVAGFYLAPSLIGLHRGVRSVAALIILNLLLGWTLLGWLVCLLWACLAATRAQDKFYTQAPAAYTEVYARERARLDHEESLKKAA